QQAQRPLCMAFGRRRACQGDEPRASASPSKVIGRADFGLSLRDMQSSKPVSTSRCLVRETLDLLVSSASMICSSVHPSPASETSALSRIRARVTNSAERRPLRRNSSRKDRSSRLKFTMYFFSATNHLHASKQQGCLIHEYDSTSRKRDTRPNRGSCLVVAPAMGGDSRVTHRAPLRSQHACDTS